MGVASRGMDTHRVIIEVSVAAGGRLRPVVTRYTGVCRCGWASDDHATQQGAVRAAAGHVRLKG